MMVIIPEDDILKFLNHNDYGATELFGKIIDYLDKEIQTAITKFKAIFPRMAKKQNCPEVIWIAPSTHSCYPNNTLRRKFGCEMDVQLRGRPSTMILKFRQIWDVTDRRLVDDKGRLTRLGLIKIWESIDRSISFANRLVFGVTVTRHQTSTAVSHVPCKRRFLPPPP